MATAVPAVSSAEAAASSTNTGPHDMVSRSKTTAVEAMDVLPITSTPEASQEHHGATGRGKPTKPKARKVIASGTDSAT